MTALILFLAALLTKEPAPLDRAKIFRQQLELINRKWDAKIYSKPYGSGKTTKKDTLKP